ncbi:MAG: GGDEF domain-containing protein [Nitrospiria bacterium]
MKQQITPTASKILSLVWKYEIENASDYLDKKFVYHAFQPEEVEEAFKLLNGSIVQEGQSGSKHYFYITFLGILLTEEGEDLLALLTDYLKHVKTIFINTPSRDSIKWEELETELHLRQDNQKLFTRLIMKSPFYTVPATVADTGWVIGLPQDMYRFKSLSDFSSYIKEIVMKGYDPDLPIDMDQKMTYEHNIRMKKHTLPKSEKIKEIEQKFKILWSPNQAEVDFQEYVVEAKEWDNPIAVFFIDIDNFKALNTRFTETKVDKTILVDAQKLLKKLVQSKGGAYRQGGEEFVVIMPNLDSKEAMEFGEKIRGTFERTPFQIEGNVERCTVSMGVALWPNNGTTYQEVLETANNAERKAKKNRNTVKLSGEE